MSYEILSVVITLVYNTFPSIVYADCYGVFNWRTFYDPDEEVCCDGKIYKRTQTLDCCGGSVIYNPETTICQAGSLRLVTTPVTP